MKKSLFHRLVATGLALALGFLTVSGAAVAATKPAPSAKVNINTASVQQLVTLPGVGEKLAARIVEHRQKEGGFKSLQELINVRGIGEKSFARLQPYISLGEASKAPSANQK